MRSGRLELELELELEPPERAQLGLRGKKGWAQRWGLGIRTGQDNVFYS